MPAEREHEPIEERDEKTYRAFQVSRWQEPDADKDAPAWRFTLIQLDNGQSRRGFACLDDLITYVRAELAVPRQIDPSYGAQKETTR